LAQLEEELGLLPSWRNAIMPSGTAAKADTDFLRRRRELRHLIHVHFDEEDLRGLCFDIGVNFGDLGGAGVDDQIRELLLMCARDGSTARLLRRLRDLRPGVDWPDGV